MFRCNRYGCLVISIAFTQDKIMTMAKVNSLITLQGTYGGITFVKSAKYGDHIRGPRGTHKKAVLNPACKKQSKKLVKANGPAKIINDAVAQYRKDFKDGNMWSRLVSLVQDQYGNDASFDFSKLKPFELHKNYRLDRFFELQTNANVDEKKSVLNVILSYNAHPMFDESLSIDGYRIGVIGIFPDQKKKSAHTTAVYSKVMELKGKAGPLKMEVPIPPKAKTFLICVRVDGCENGEIYDTLASKAMKIVEGGVLDK
jgi:hypothetical protein